MENKAYYHTLISGQRMPVIGMGTFASDNYGSGAVAEAVAGAIDYGWRMFDCASIYGNEDVIGEAFTRKIAERVVSRDDLFITSKVWNDMHGRGDVLISIAKTLKDLRLDYLDCYLVHWPFPNYHPPGFTVESRSPDARPYTHDEYMGVWRQMEKLVKAGLTRSIGVSNMTIPKMKLLLRDCEIKPAVIEAELHPSFQQTELCKYCVSHGIKVIGFCPIGSPGRPERDRTPDDVTDMDMQVIKDIAEKRGIHPALVCIKWAVRRGHTPIPFSVTPSKYKANLEAAMSDPLTDEEMASIASCERGCRLVKGHVFLWDGVKDWNDLWND